MGKNLKALSHDIPGGTEMSVVVRYRIQIRVMVRTQLIFERIGLEVIQILRLVNRLRWQRVLYLLQSQYENLREQNCNCKNYTTI
jgi:hypothetical protein